MNKTQEILLNTFLEICDTLIEDSWVVTDGFNVDMVSFDKEFAEKRCKKLIRDTEKNKENSLWVVCPIKNVAQYGFKVGVDVASKNENGELIGKQTEELRNGELQSVQETD